MKLKHLNSVEVKALQRQGVLLQAAQIQDKIYKDTGLDVSVRFRMRVRDYTENAFAPEQYAYAISWECQYTGKRDKCVYYPNTVGMQG